MPSSSLSVCLYALFCTFLSTIITLGQTVFSEMISLEAALKFVMTSCLTH